MKVLITSPALCAPASAEIAAYAREQFDEVIFNPYGRKVRPEELMELWDGVDAIIAGLEIYDAKTLEQAPVTLKVISRYGVGYDNVDAAAATARGITVTVTRNANTEAVADCAMAILMAAARRIPLYDRKVRSGEWGFYVGDDVYQKTIGIVGLGAIGKAVALRAKGFSMKILAYDPFFDKAFAEQNGIRQACLDELYEQSDYITLHLPVTPMSKGMINAAALERMKNTAYLINCARGELVNEDDLYNALKENKIKGAALDVYRCEPTTESPLFELENTVFLPHLAGHTIGAARKMGMMTIQNVLDVLAGKQNSNIVKA